MHDFEIAYAIFAICVSKTFANRFSKLQQQKNFLVVNPNVNYFFTLVKV